MELRTTSECDKRGASRVANGAMTVKMIEDLTQVNSAVKRQSLSLSGSVLPYENQREGSKTP